MLPGWGRRYPGPVLSLLLRLGAALTGLALLAVRARWVRAEELVFRVDWLGAVLFEGGASAFRGAVAEALPAAALAVGLASAGLGLALGRALHRRLGDPGTRPHPAFLLACAGTVFAALNPGVVAFVAARRELGARAYLDVEDLLHAAAWSLLFLACVPRAARHASRAAEPGATGAAAAGRERLQVALACLVALAGPGWIADRVLGGHSLTNDEHAYRFQAELFAAGDLVHEPPPGVDLRFFLSLIHI